MNEAAETIEPSAQESDADLLARVLNGDLVAYEGIMRRHNQRLFRLARSIVTVDAEAMDVVQESYITAYERLADLRDPASLGTWLCRIARNTSLMHLRKNRRYQVMNEPELENVLNFSRPTAEQEQPDRQLATEELRRLLESCVDQLPEVFRTVFMLRAVEHCSVNTVAEILGIKEATVKTRFHRARRLLQKHLLEYSDTGSIAIHEFAGARCEAIVQGVLRQLRSGCP